MELLQERDAQGLAELAEKEPRAVRVLLGRLFDGDDQTRGLAADAIGASASARPHAAVELCRRLIWALNDESGMNGAPGIAALGSIGRAAPDAFAPFVAPLASCAWDPALRVEILRALTRVAETAPALVRPVLGTVIPHVDDTNATEREALAQLVAVAGGSSDVF